MILSYSFSIRVEAELAIRSETRRCANFCMDCQLTEPQLCRQENWKPKTESWKAQISWCFLKSSVTYLPTLFDWQFRCIKSLRIRIPICTKWLHFDMEMYGNVACLLLKFRAFWLRIGLPGAPAVAVALGEADNESAVKFLYVRQPRCWRLATWASRARQMES